MTQPEELAQLAPSCLAVSETLARIGEKWSMLLALLLHGGARRFSELREFLRLRGLERDGLVKRTLYPTVPPRVDYELTALGQSLSRPIAALGDWAKSHEREIREARQAFDAESDGGALRG